MQKVQKNLPELEALRQRAKASEQDIALARNTLTPDLNAGYQVNMATFNNITGMSYPGFLLPISGPPSLNNRMNFVPGSAAGALLKWNPFTFGKRDAAIELATAQFKQANLSYNEQLFRYQYRAINVYLEAVYHQHVLRSLQAAIDRNRVSLNQILVLAQTGLKPGIDTAESQAAITQAEMDYLQTELVLQQELTELTRLTGDSAAQPSILLTDTLFSPGLSLVLDTSLSINQHPIYQQLEAQKRVTEAGLQEVKKSLMPQLDFWGNLYARGSGIAANGNIDKTAGLGFSRTNAGAGVQLLFPLLQYGRVNIKKKQYQSLLLADDARLAQASLDIRKQSETASQQYAQAIKIAQKSQQLTKAATAVYDGLQLGYQNGLIDYTRLFNAQYDLQRAEVNDANYQLQVWRALLNVAIAKGNLNLFTDQLK